MKFHKKINKNGLAFFFLKLSTSDLKVILNKKSYKRFFEIDTDTQIGYISEDDGFVIHYNEVDRGFIFRSQKDLIIYNNELSGNFVSGFFERAFIDGDGLITTYFEVCYSEITYYEESEEKNIFKDSKLILDRNTTLYFPTQLSLEKYKNIKDTPHSILYGCNPFGKNLLDKTDEILESQLIDTLGITKLDFSEKSLKSIDQTLHKMKWNDVLFYQTFLGLTLYLGESIIRNSNLFTWKLVLEKDQIYVPYLISKEDSDPIPIAMNIYESFKSEYYIASNLYLLYCGFVDTTPQENKLDY